MFLHRISFFPVKKFLMCCAYNAAMKIRSILTYLLLILFSLASHATLSFSIKSIDGVAYSTGQQISFSKLKTITATIGGPNTIPITVNVLNSSGKTIKAGIIGTAHLAGMTTTPGVIAIDATAINGLGLADGSYIFEFVLSDTAKFSFSTGAFESVSFRFPLVNSSSAGVGAECQTPTCTTPSVDLLPAGWHLLGNTGDATIFNVAFNDPAISTVWRWNAFNAVWEFYTPTMPSDGGCNYALSKGYQCLSAIQPGSGYWINLKSPMAKPLYNGSVPLATVRTTVRTGWNLLAVADALTPKQTSTQLGTPIISTLWAWDNTQSKWYFYAPSLDASNTLAAYCQDKGYIDFATAIKALGSGVGFWVNKPAQ